MYYQMILQFFSIVFIIVFGYCTKFQFNTQSPSKKKDVNYIKTADDIFGTTIIEWHLENNQVSWEKDT